MSAERAESALQAPLADLERALIEAFVEQLGFHAEAFARLSVAERAALLRAASLFASSRLAEVESRAHYIHELHG